MKKKVILTEERLKKWVFGTNEEALEVEEEIESETVDCPIHGELGGINECPKC